VIANSDSLKHTAYSDSSDSQACACMLVIANSDSL
jgi:hypothetical protein